ncbi:MAG: TM2 domain-containing protein [Acutalibacteraceae bacterium]|nr:TM2 domain-containing protein [Clostridia bacterium]MEE1330488.1 TM2 domain-containing protein [Acutalibacteraceae bacterium]
MDQNKVDMYIMTNQKYFPAEKIMYIKEKLLAMDESKFSLISTVDLKDPTTLLLVSIFIGGLGIDRFMLGDVGMGILKLLTGGCCGILTIVDWFTISNKTRERNFNSLMTIL